MSLQRRLTAFFILIVVLPLGAAGYIVQDVIVDEVTKRAELGLEPAANTVIGRYNDRVAVLGELTQSRIRRDPDFARVLDRGDRARTERFLESRLAATQGLDFLIALDVGGGIAGGAVREAEFISDFAPPTVEEIMNGPTAGRGYARTDPIRVRSPGGNIGFIVGGFWLDATLFEGTRQTDVNTYLVSDGRIIASSQDLEQTVGVGELDPGRGEVEVDGPGAAEVRTVGGDMQVLAWTSNEPAQSLRRGVLGSLIGLLLLAVIATAFLAYLLARLITRPLDELADGARAIAAGRFDYRIPVRSRDEVGQLAESFNEMSDQLDLVITDLESSRDQLQRVVERVGATLRSTHDMGQILDSILSTAADAVSADAGCLWLFTGTRDELYPALSVGVNENALDRLRVGEGVTGLSAERGITVVLPVKGGGPKPARSEPHFPVTMAVPLFSSHRVTGVIVLYRNDAGEQFGRSDTETVAFLAEQGGVAIENVLLHEEAQRLSLTDGLTGVWNRRYLQMQFKQTLASANRFDRPFSVLLLDLDHFKNVNDNHGHQRGDSILIEFAQRVGAMLREIDTFVRYGGEEFICLLSETDVSGARTTAEKIRQSISGDPFTSVGEDPVTLTVSIGVACYPLHGSGYQSLIEAADQALYRAKEEGRDRVRLAERPAPDLHLAT